MAVTRSIDIACARKNTEILQIVAERIGWSITREKGGTIIWVLFKDDLAEKLLKLKAGQWLSHIPGMHEACGKVALDQAMKESENAFFWPQSWEASKDSPADIAEICHLAFASGPATLIVKPNEGTQGQGIALARSPKELGRIIERMLAPRAIVQEYIDRPLLLDKRKWDMRIYVLAIPSSTGNDFTCFLAQEGLARVCIDRYEIPTDRNLHRLTVHLTNYSLSKFSDNFVFNEDPHNSNTGCKRTLSAVLKRLQEEGTAGITVPSAWEMLARLSRQTINAMSQSLSTLAFSPSNWDGDSRVAEAASNNFYKSFHILGLDVLFDEAGNPWLLEVNCNPSLSVDEVRPLPGIKSQADVNMLFAQARKSIQPGTKWGRPCRCASHPRPHAHHQCPVDCAIKIPVVEGTLKIIERVRGDPLGSKDLCEGTIFFQI
eukprot:TRINITY_DN68537_c0_g1_i1.p1 TRINITY_DN68537_c0_g1~~TRINITY_DN68537_c0_g1_i1.p1  ORF type:complete len:432 (-),score=58.34 TRINITY_DN68537_c0_g1_i1:115-1410(-)